MNCLRQEWLVEEDPYVVAFVARILATLTVAVNTVCVQMIKGFKRFAAWIGECMVPMILKLDHCPCAGPVTKKVVSTQAANAVQVIAEMQG